MPHTTVHVFSCSSHPTSLTELDQWERPCLASEFLSSLPFFELPHLLPLPLSPLLLTDKRVRGKHYHHWLQILVCLCTGCDSRLHVYCLFYKLFDRKFWFVLAQNATVSYVYIFLFCKLFHLKFWFVLPQATKASSATRRRKNASPCPAFTGSVHRLDCAKIIILTPNLLYLC